MAQLGLAWLSSGCGVAQLRRVQRGAVGSAAAPSSHLGSAPHAVETLYLNGQRWWNWSGTLRMLWMNVLCMNVNNEEKLIKSGFVPPKLWILSVFGLFPRLKYIFCIFLRVHWRKKLEGSNEVSLLCQTKSSVTVLLVPGSAGEITTHFEVCKKLIKASQLGLTYANPMLGHF
jgi:hypothetical protein